MELDDLPQPVFDGLVTTDSLTADGENPNQMPQERFELLCDRIQQRGWVGNAIITDTDGVIADGQHRWEAAQEIGLEKVPVKQYAMDDAERRLIRQELNKIKGSHNRDKDAYEYDKILSGGYGEPLEELATTRDEDLEQMLDEVTETAEAEDISDGVDITPDAPDNPKQPPTVQSGDVDPHQEWENSSDTDYENEQKLPRYAEVKVKFKDEDAMNRFADMMGQTVTKKTNVLHFPKSEEWSMVDNRINSEGISSNE